ERGCSPEEALFGEGSGGFLIRGDRVALEGLGATLLGEVGGGAVEIAAGDRSLTIDLESAESAWRSPPAQVGAASEATDDDASGTSVSAAPAGLETGRRVKVTAPATSAAITAKRKAPSETERASLSEAGSPTIATRIAVPRTAPT